MSQFQIGEKVLVIGLGASGMDIVRQLCTTVSLLVSSQTKNKDLYKIKGFKGQVLRFTGNGAEFDDGSIFNFTSVIYATGKKMFDKMLC